MPTQDEKKALDLILNELDEARNKFNNSFVAIKEKYKISPSLNVHNQMVCFDFNYEDLLSGVEKSMPDALQ